MAKTAKKKTSKKVTKKMVAKGAKKTTKKAAKATAKKTTKKTMSKATGKSAKAAPKAKKKAAKAAPHKLASIPKSSVNVGGLVPNFELPATTQGQISLESLRGKKVVLYFYPKDCTPGCTIEGHDFTRLHNEFKNAGAEVLGLSRDTMALHEKFKSQENFSFELLSDQEEKVCSLFGVIKMKNMYGKQVRGIERSTFVIDSDGVLRKEWRGIKVEGHAQEVLDLIRQM